MSFAAASLDIPEDAVVAEQTVVIQSINRREIHQQVLDASLHDRSHCLD